MTPIEIAARAAWNLHHPPSKSWEEVPEIIRRSKIRQMEVALLALAECELPDEAIEAAQASPSQFAADPTQWHVGSFRAMLRSIANEGKSDG